MPDKPHGVDKGERSSGVKPAEAATHGANDGMAHASGTAENEAAADLVLDVEDMMEIERKKEAEREDRAASNTATSATGAAAKNDETKSETKGNEESAASAKAASSEPIGAMKKAASTTSDNSTGTRFSTRERESSLASATSALAPPSNTPKEIEVLDPARNYQQVRVLKSVSEGKRVFGVSRHMLSKVCDSGGGVIQETGYFYRYFNNEKYSADAAAAAPPVAAESTAKVGGSSAGSEQHHLTEAALKRHNESHQQQQQQPQSKHPGTNVGKRIEPPKQAAVASSQLYGGTFPFYSSQSGPPPPSAIGYLNASILRATMSGVASAPREAQSPLRHPSMAASSAASSNKMVSYSAYPPTQFPSADEIEASIPANASSIFHILDRRINFDAFNRDASFYSLLRGWVQDDPYRCNSSMQSQILAGGDWVQVNEGDCLERPKKRKRVNGGPVDVLALLQQHKGNLERPTMVELRREHVARAKEIQLEARKLDRLKMARARVSLERRYGVTL